MDIQKDDEICSISRSEIESTYLLWDQLLPMRPPQLSSIPGMLGIISTAALETSPNLTPSIKILELAKGGIRSMNSAGLLITQHNMYGNNKEFYSR